MNKDTNGEYVRNNIRKVIQRNYKDIKEPQEINIILKPEQNIFYQMMMFSVLFLGFIWLIFSLNRGNGWFYLLGMIIAYFMAVFFDKTGIEK